MPFLSILIISVLASAAISVGLFALLRGTTTERIAGVVFVGSVPVSVLVGYLPAAWRTLGQLGCDALLALVFLALVVTSASRWLGAVMLLYALQFALHATYLVAGWAPDKLHILANNLIFIAVMMCLLFGTLGAQARRRAAGPAEAA